MKQQSDVPVRVERHQKNSLNNRFAPIPSLRTDAVLSIGTIEFIRHEVTRLKEWLIATLV